MTRILDSDEYRETYEVSLPTDSDGFLERQCPEEVCKAFFKVRLEPSGSGSEFTCPLCGHKAECNEFTSPQQMEFMEATAVNQFSDKLLDEISEMLTFKPSSNRNSLISFDVKTTRSPSEEVEFISDSRDVAVKTVCPECGFVTLTEVPAVYCPGCSKKFM